MIKVSALTYGYQSKKLILDNLNLTAISGEIHGIIGKNGHGKTTLFKCILGLINDYNGDITFENLNPRNLGFLLSELYFYPRITGLEYIEFMLISRKKTINKDLINKWNSFFELPLSEYAENYSTGMQKKLALMALILQENEILILDEPFNGLDLESKILVREILKLCKKTTTILISSHILDGLTSISDKISLLEKGQNIKTYDPFEFEKIELDIRNQLKLNHGNIQSLF